MTWCQQNNWRLLALSCQNISQDNKNIFSAHNLIIRNIYSKVSRLVTKLLHWRLIISCEHCRAIIRRQPTRKYYLSRSEWGVSWVEWMCGEGEGEGRGVLENHFQYFWWYQDKSCPGSRVWLNTKIMSQPSRLRYVNQNDFVILKLLNWSWTANPSVTLKLK